MNLSMESQAFIIVECTWGDGPDVCMSVKHTDARPNVGLFLSRGEARSIAELLNQAADRADWIENKLFLESLLLPPVLF